MIIEEAELEVAAPAKAQTAPRPRIQPVAPKKNIKPV